jgi:hypothetical protein
MDLEKTISNEYNNKNIIYNDQLTDETCESYKKLNSDLVNLSNDELRSHWRNVGKNANKKVSTDKVINIYFKYYDNDVYICQGKWLMYLMSSQDNFIKYNNFILTNDSFIISNSLKNFGDLKFLNTEMYGLVASNQIKYHYTDFLRGYNKTGIKKIINYYNDNKYLIKNYMDAIMIYEIDSTYIFHNKKVLYENMYNYDGNLHFDEDIMKDYLLHKNYPIIKLRYIRSKNKMPEFLNNYLKTNNIKNITEIQTCKHLFHKYYLNIKNCNEKITYNVIYSTINKNINKILCIHCYDFSKVDDYFKEIISEYNKNYTIIITFTIGGFTNDFLNRFDSLVLLKIKNKGVDIGSKLICMQYFKDIQLDYKFALFLHSKSDDIDRNQFMKPFIGRSILLEYVFENNIDCIFPDYHNIYVNKNLNNNCIKGMEKYYEEFCSFFNITKDSECLFNGTNVFALTKKFIDLFSENLAFLYNNLNEDNDYDYNWHKLYYGLNNLTLEEDYKFYLNNKNIGNDWYLRNSLHENGIRNGCYEHIFERMWINILKSYNCNFIVLPLTSIKSFYNIKINAIYFPQFHNSEENNKNWGEGFTEWTLLNPFPDVITVRDSEIQIMKPHDNIGYYSLDNVSTFTQQINTAKDYNIDGFVIYHYWFGNNRSVLNKVEQHILNGHCNFPFCFSWANEPWTNQWEGGTQSGDNMLIDQNYEDDDNLEHIHYLLTFFKKPNYIKNIHNECLFYIYNFNHIKEKLENITKKWIKVAMEHNIKIKFITTINADEKNRKNGTRTKFLFSPMCHTKVWNSFPESDLLSNGNFVKKLPWHIEVNYEDLIEDYKSINNVDNLHLGLPLHWNNIVRKKNKPHLHINHFTIYNLEKMLYVLISKIITKYKNKLSLNSIEKYNVTPVTIEASQFNLDNNTIIVNAWNEWNEQAILEPNNVTGYSNLELINGFFQKL